MANDQNQPPFPGMSRSHIMYLFSQLHQGMGRPELQNMLINYGFVVIMDEWRDVDVYVGNDPQRFTNWVLDPTYVPNHSTVSFFTNQ